MSHRAGYPAPDSCRLLWLPPASLSHFTTTPATHYNFSFNFSILSVIYTCHAMASEALSRSPMPRFPFGPLRFACFLPFGFFFLFVSLSDGRLCFCSCHRFWLYPAYLGAFPTRAGGLHSSIKSNSTDRNNYWNHSRSFKRNDVWTVDPC